MGIDPHELPTPYFQTFLSLRTTNPATKSSCPSRPPSRWNAPNVRNLCTPQRRRSQQDSSSTRAASNVTCATSSWRAPMWRNTRGNSSADSAMAGSSAPRDTDSEVALELWAWTRGRDSETRSARWATNPVASVFNLNTVLHVWQRVGSARGVTERREVWRNQQSCHWSQRQLVEASTLLERDAAYSLC